MRKPRKASSTLLPILSCLTLMTLIQAAEPGIPTANVASTSALPGEVTGVVWCDARCLQWNTTDGATTYRVYRGETASEPCLMNSALDSCRKGFYYDPTTGAGAIPENPGSGRFYWYLVTAFNESGESTSGNARADGSPVARIRNLSGVCPQSCSASGQPCSIASDCCSNLCAGSCTATCGCQANGTPCASPLECCSGICACGVCASTTCCGNGLVQSNEQCDDGNQTAGDGCSSTCTGEPGFACSGEPSICTPCPGGFANCNGSSQDGCEIETSTDSANCGQCGHDCTAAYSTASCAAGVCQWTCNPGFADCDQNTAGCETDVTRDVQNCGQCGRVCTFPHATAFCSNGTCQFEACSSGWGDCNHDPSDGCETALDSNTNCGGCGVECTATCNAGVCCSASGSSCAGATCCGANLCLGGTCCLWSFSSCSAGDVCCANPCTNGVCCTPQGGGCGIPGNQCCSPLVCRNNFCTTNTCLPHGASCTMFSTCCNGTCIGNTCP